MKPNVYPHKHRHIDGPVGQIARDCKYKWIIVISYAIANDKFDEMKMPATDMTLIININSALSMSLGLINGPLLRYFGYRKISVIAASLFSLGLVLTALTDSIVGFIITYGVITAVGYGLSNSSFALALNSYFRDDLNRASGVAMTLAGIGPIVYPPLINYLMHVYDVSGCMLVIGALALHMLVAAVLLQPVKWHTVKEPIILVNKHLIVPMILPNVSTQQSIGQFSDRSSMCNGRLNEFGSERRSYFEVNHDIDTQSIYGFDQLVHRPSVRLDQVSIARNFSKRTLCWNPAQNSQVGLSDIISHNTDTTPLEEEPKKPLRWFESASMNSIHLGSSMEIFKEQPQPAPANQNRRKSSLFLPLRRQSIQLMEAFRKNIRSSHRNTEPCIENEIKHNEPATNKLNIMIEADETEEIQMNLQSPTEEKSSSCCCDIFRWFVRFFDLDLLRDNIYLNIMIGMAISIFAEINFAILTPFLLTDLNFGSDDIAMILLVMAIADLISRFCSPFIADHLQLSIRTSYLISLVLLLATRMCMIFTTDYIQMLVVSVILGLAKGIRSVYMCIVIPSYIPIERLASASAIQLFANGIFMMFFGPILGLIKDFSGSYIGCILFLNICTVTTIFMYSIEMLYVWCKEKHSTEN